MAFSKNVDNLKKMGLIDNTITYGNAFGGDYECINIYTSLITAKEICKGVMGYALVSRSLVCKTDSRYDVRPTI